MSEDIEQLVAEGVRLADDHRRKVAHIAEHLLDDASPVDVHRLACMMLAEMITGQIRLATYRAERAAQDRAASEAQRRHDREAHERAVEKRREKAERDEHFAESDARREREHWNHIHQIVQDYTDKVVADARIEWTRDLLDSSLPLGDGTRTTWGQATIEQHEARAAMFEQYAQSNVDGAVRHRAAIAALRGSAYVCLNDLVLQPGVLIV
jgi:hypothetical protein